MSTTMLYKQGSMITCGTLLLDYIIVPDDEVNETLTQGWFKTPQETVVKEQEIADKPKAKKAVKDGKDEG